MFGKMVNCFESGSSQCTVKLSRCRRASVSIHELSTNVALFCMNLLATPYIRRGCVVDPICSVLCGYAATTKDALLQRRIECATFC